MNTTISLKDYLSKGKKFVIPNYQRGYVWGKKRANETDSVSHLMNTIRMGFEANHSIFLQGVTVTESGDDVVIIDGQQRTTCLFLLLKFLGCKENFTIEYEIRKESSEYLKNIKVDESEQQGDKFQDIFFFKKSMRIIRECFSHCDRDKLMSFVLDQIKFLYINIPDNSQAIKVFTMMNGNKAQMKTEEIIKAELLRIASSGQTSGAPESDDDYAMEWSNNMLRSRYAREWDKWLHWWNRDQVRRLYKCENVMGLLIKMYYDDPEKELTFESFKSKHLASSHAKQAKDVFDQLRRLQKRFEDAFNDPIAYNRIGAILRILSSTDKVAFILTYFKEDVLRIKLEGYYKCAFLGMTHLEIMSYLDGGNSTVYDEKFGTVLEAINDDFAYSTTNKEDVFRLLLRLNIEEDCKRNQIDSCSGRKFDFSIWDRGVRSLEHIQAKSKVWHKIEDRWCNGNDEEVPSSVEGDAAYMARESIRFTSGDSSVLTTSEHSIGNLVLLYRNENSAFGAKSFEEKKALFFDPEVKEYFDSRHLLHTIYAFSKSTWDGAAIAENKYKMILNFKGYYGKQD